jgi:hypothetical protein
MAKEITTAEAAAIIEEAEAAAKAARRALRNVKTAAGELALPQADSLAMTLVELADVVDDLAALVEQIARRQEAIETNQIARALQRRDPDQQTEASMAQLFLSFAVGDSRLVEVPPGSDTADCRRCGKPVWVSPAGRAVIRRNKPEICCADCITRDELLLMATGQAQVEVTAGQANELADYLRRRYSK